jgi:outer membrane lipoprotein
VVASGSASGSDPAAGVTRTLFGLLLFILAVSAVLGLDACAPAISQKLRDEAGIPVPYRDFLAHPDTYQGRIVILGGYILETQNEQHGSVLTVLQTPLDFQNKPKARDLSEGRFLITTDRFLDPEIYAKDRLITVGGRVAGVREQSVGGTTYRYPIIKAQELHLWPKEVYPPGPPPYYPYYPWYDPWYPWWHRYPWWW